MSDMKSHVAVLTMVLHIPLAHSLKEKRSVVKSLKEKLANKFSLSVAEVADLMVGMLLSWGQTRLEIEIEIIDDTGIQYLQ